MAERIITSGEITATLELDARGPGQVVVRASLDREEQGTVEEGLTSLTGDPLDTFDVSFQPASVHRVRSLYDNTVRQIASALGTTADVVVMSGATDVSWDLAQALGTRITGQIETDSGEVSSFSHMYSFQPIEYPHYDGLDYKTPRDIYNDMEIKPEITIQVEAADFIQRTLSSPIVATFEVPIHALVDRVNPQVTDCEEIYPRLVTETMEKTNSVDRTMNSVESSMDDIANLYSRLGNALQMDPSEASVTDLEEVDSESLDNLMTNAKNTPLDDTVNISGVGDMRVEDAVVELESLEAKVRNRMALDDCSGTYTSAVSTTLEDLRGLEGRATETRQMKRVIENLLVGTEDIIREREDIEETIDQVAEELPCFEEFSAIENRITEFENMVINIGRSPTERQVQQAISEGEGLIDDIESNVDKERCLEDFKGRVESTLRSIENRTSSEGIFFRESVEDEEVQRQRETIANLRNRLDALSI